MDRGIDPLNDHDTTAVAGQEGRGEPPVWSVDPPCRMDGRGTFEVGLLRLSGGILGDGEDDSC